ncbi:hypothetical protein GIB67_014101 [Kingdonia uniflora]|uniref:Uncharacterized protein n=1 Tax=Kingdonia uniflora TaxID=39325 RepID=A0A7J7KXM3_9MAGN|nr:hypothetical protein GIB67_014101 [Kingdonia uniflora]
MQRAHQKRAMATSDPAYANVMEIPACVVGTSSSLVRRPRIKKMVPSSEQTAPVQIPSVGTERVDTDLSVAWKSAVEILKLASANRGELVRQHDAEKAALRAQFEQEKKDKFEKEAAATKQEVEGKYGEIIFLGDDASPVAEKTPAPPVADDPTKKEVVPLRRKVIEMEKALSRARDYINRTQQQRLQVSQSRLKKQITPKRGKRATNTDHERQIADVIAFYGGELERVENEFRRYITSYGKNVEVENDKVENMWFAKGNKGGGGSTSKLRAEEFEEEEVEDLLPHTRHKTHPQEVEHKEWDKLAALSASNKKLSAKLQQCPLAVEKMTLLNSKLESKMLELQSQLNTVTVELSCKDAVILTANNEAELWKESLKKKKLETMSANQQVLDLLSTIKTQKNDLLSYQSVVTNNTDLLKKQDAEIRHMRERLKKLNWDLPEARDSCQKKNDRAKSHEEACSKRNRELNEAINKYNLWIADLDRGKQALVLECMQGNKVFEELHVKYKELQRMMDAAEAEINYSREEKKSLEARCKDLEDELNKVKIKFCEATLLIVDSATLCAMVMLHADVEKFRTERESILAATTEYITKYDLQLARLSYIDNLMMRVMKLLNAPSTVVHAAIPFPVLLSSGLRKSLNVVRPMREQ